jgi:hypothetical protein
MSSKREAIVSAFVTALSAGGKPSGLTVHRYRTIPIGTDILPAQLVYVVREDVETGPGSSHYVATRRCIIRVETRLAVDDPSTTAPDAALDAFLSWAVQAICADPTLSGAVLDVWERSTEWAATDADKVFAGGQTDFEVRYQTLASDPDAQPS